MHRACRKICSLTLFVSFVKHKALKLGGDDPFQAAEEVGFEDVAPVGEVKRRAAAAAFVSNQARQIWTSIG